MYFAVVGARRKARSNRATIFVGAVWSSAAACVRAMRANGAVEAALLPDIAERRRGQEKAGAALWGCVSAALIAEPADQCFRWGGSQYPNNTRVGMPTKSHSIARMPGFSTIQFILETFAVPLSLIDVIHSLAIPSSVDKVRFKNRSEPEPISSQTQR
ncbi:hypothetical protein B0H14DRAFT_1295934 [Mycena olivaceomarginata]|nr:hypothetical protein B0H14DRAFT_1295934 [Mycena olivaceomarginata]